jgi:thioesterase domain-containing protein
VKHPNCAILRLGEVSPHKPKLFVLAGANVFTRLAKELEADWSVYGLVSDKEIFPVDSHEQATSFSIEDLSEDYYAAMTAEQASGPYHILAHSFGGIVAYDLAKLLESRNHSIGKLILLDPLLPEWASPLRFRLMQFLRIFRTPPSELWRFFEMRLRERRPFAKLKAKLLRSNPLKSDQVDIPSITSYSGVLADMDVVRVRTKQQAAVVYMKKIKPSFDEAILFLSSVRQRQNPLHSKTLTWDKYIRKLRVLWLDVAHEMMIEDPEALAKIRQEIVV